MLLDQYCWNHLADIVISKVIVRLFDRLVKIILIGITTPVVITEAFMQAYVVVVRPGAKGAQIREN